MGIYEDTFGSEAADAFTKAIRAWHAGIKVIGNADVNDTNVVDMPEKPNRSTAATDAGRPRPPH